MPLSFSRRFVIAVSSRALFDLSRENAIFDEQGAAAFEKYQLDREHDPPPPGPAYRLIRNMLSLNKYLPADRHIEVVLTSRNSASAGIRIKRAITKSGLNITRSVFSSGDPVAPYLQAFNVDLFLSADAADVRTAWENGFASALVFGAPKTQIETEPGTIRIAFDGDAVLFSEASEKIYQSEGLDAFHKHERDNSEQPLEYGPFAKVLLSLSYIRRRLPKDASLIKTIIVTARNGPSDIRVLNTLRHWNVGVDTVLFLGGLDKSSFLSAVNADIYFDDQLSHCAGASTVVPTAQVPSNLFLLAGAVTPDCPRCGKPMKLKTARRGETAGKRFYGCSAYPACRGSVSVA